MFRFENVVALYGLWLLPILWTLEWIFYRRLKAKMQKAWGEHHSFLAASTSVKKRRWKLILRSLVLALMIVALARPQMGESKEEIRVEGIEVMLLVDVSESMLADDVKPNRLEQAKSELAKLLDILPGNKVGVIAFAGSAHLLSPLSTDPSAIRLYLETLSTESVSAQGTEFQSALIEAKEAFRRGGVAKDDRTQVSRIIIVASDGEDHEQGALDEAKKFVDEGIRIFTLAYGTEKGGTIPMRDNLGFLRGYKKDRSGQTVITTVKGDFLRSLAQAGQGSFYHATFGGRHLKDLAEDIDKLQKAQFETSVATQYDERFQIVLLLAFCLALIELWLGERKKAPRYWKGRFEVPLAAMIALSPGTIQKNNQGVEALQKENPRQAEEYFIQGLSSAPMSAEIQYNLGLAFYQQGQMEKAMQAFRTAEEMAQNKETKFSALFNLGEIQQKAKNVDEALKYYQAALDVKPDSVEAKTNIELLIQEQQKGGQGQNQQQNQNNDKNDSQDQSQKSEGDKNQDSDKDKNEEEGKDKKDENNQNKQYSKNKPQPKPFKSEELTQADVNKILGELKQQEQKIRAEFNRKEVKEKPRDKDW